jgi:hypothetical protein
VGVIRALTRLRIRFLLVTAAAWLVALVIATTAHPTDRALPAGLIAGTLGSLGLWFATAQGITFTWAQDTTYWPDDTKTPKGEWLAATYLTLIATTATIALISN